MISLLFLFLAGAGCRRPAPVSTRAAGHPITARIEGDHSLDSGDQRGTISSEHGSITIEPTRIKLDDAPWTAIAEGVPVEMSIARGKVRITAGRVTIERTHN